MGNRRRFSVLRRFSFLSWALMISLLILGAYFVYGSLRIRQIQIDIKNYSVAPFCDGESRCRQMIQARVLESRTVDTSTYIRSPRTRTSNFRTKKIDDKRVYLVVLQSDNHEKYEVAIVPNLKLDTNLFGVENVYFPVHQIGHEFDIFAERSFPPGAILDVELWNGQLTLIYSRYVDSEYAVSSVLLIDPLVFPIADTKNSELQTTYAIPTTNHPLVAGEVVPEKFYRSLGMLTVVPVLVIVLKALTIKL